MNGVSLLPSGQILTACVSSLCDISYEMQNLTCAHSPKPIPVVTVPLVVCVQHRTLIKLNQSCLHIFA